MKGLKLKFYQETACYKKAYAFKVTETYPLPPYSTIIGFMHKILGAESGQYHKMQVSVQGKYEGIFTTYNTTRFYKGNIVTSMPMNVHMLYGVNLIVHVVSDENILKDIYKGFKKTSEAFTLGRGEDLARLDEIRYVDIKRNKLDDDSDDIVLKNCMYVPNVYNTLLHGIGYNLNKVYTINNNLRQWEKVKVKYVESEELLSQGEYFIDEDKDILFLA